MADSLAEHRLLVRLNLEPEYRVVDCASLGEVVPLARIVRPDVFLLEIFFPEGPGWDLLAVLRCDAELGSVPVLLLTTQQGERDRTRALRLGVEDLIAKPPDFQDLRRRVAEVLEHRGTRRLRTAG